MRNIFPACLAIVALACGTASAAWRQPEPGLPDTFTIGIQASLEFTEADVAQAADAGFNLVVPIRPSAEDSKKLLQACQQAKIQGVVWDPRLCTYELGGWQLTSQAIREYRGLKDAVACYSIATIQPVPPVRTSNLQYRAWEVGMNDEQKYRYAEALTLNKFDNEREFTGYLYQITTRSLGYILLVEDAPYSDQAIKAMQIATRITESRKCELWRRCELQDATPANFRWQAFSSAAAGARGVLSLVLRPMPGFREDSLLDAEGQPTPLFDAAKATNRRLKAIGLILMKTNCTQLCAVGKIDVAAGNLPGDAGVAKIESDAADDGFLVGLLTNDDAQYVFVVRKPSAEEKPANVTVTPAAGKQLILAETGNPLAAPLQLLPGEGQLLEVK